MLKKLVMAVLIVTLAAGTALAQGKKKIVFASDATWPPMEFVDANKKIVGFAPELLEAMAKEGGFELEIKNTAWDGIFAGLENKKYDAISSSVSITDERKKAMDFSEPYFEVKQAVVIQADKPIKSVADLKGKTVGAQIGTTGYFVAKKIAGAEAKSYDEIGLAMEDLFSGRIDAVSCDDPVAAQYALQKDEYKGKMKIAFIVPADEKEFYGFPVKKGDKETLALINKGLKAVMDKGIYQKIKDKWIPPVK
jgi:polar amino acid transport system substrate-binding protein